MATVEREIDAGGAGDYTTIAAWEAGTNLNAGADIWKGIIVDDSSYDESVTFSGASGATSSSYVWLTVDQANRHAGVWDTGAARISYTGANTAAIHLSDPYAHLEYLQVTRPSGMGTSDEAIRVGDTECVLSRLILWSSDLSQIQNDGIHFPSEFRDSAVGPNCYVDHCVVYGWFRMGMFMNYTETDMDIYVDHCMIVYNRDNPGGQGLSFTGNIAMLEVSAGQFGTLAIYNSLVATQIDNGTGTQQAEVDGDDIALATIAGSHNCRTTGFGTPRGWATDSTTDWADADDGTTDNASSTSGAIVTDFTGVSTFDLTPVQADGNELLAAGTNRIGSEPDARQDFSIDIRGRPRGTTEIDIGAFQISGDGIMPPRLSPARRHLLNR